MSETAGPIEQTSQEIEPDLPPFPLTRRALLRVSDVILHELEELTVKGVRIMPVFVRASVLMFAYALGDDDLNPRRHKFFYVSAAMKHVMKLQGEKLMFTDEAILTAEEERAREAGWNI